MPLDKILHSLGTCAFIEYLFYVVFFMSINDHQQWAFQLSLWEQCSIVLMVGLDLRHMESGVDVGLISPVFRAKVISMIVVS